MTPQQLPFPFAGTVSVAEEQSRLAHAIKDGTECVCCGQFVKTYRYSLSENNCRFLGALHAIFLQKPGIYTHSDDLLASDPGFRASRDYNRLLYWGLMEEEAPEGDKKRSGLWRITVKGLLFARGQITIPKYVRVYNDKILNFEGDEVLIHHFEGERFSYHLHMSQG